MQRKGTQDKSSAPSTPSPASALPLGWYKDRIKELRRVPASSLTPHPRNPRRHGDDQRASMQGVLRRLGIVDTLLVREVKEGEYQILDGHMRAEIITGGQDIPVLVLDVDEAEADMVVATHDILTEMGLYDEEQSDELARSLWTEDDAVNTLLRELMGHQPAESSGEGKGKGRGHLGDHPLGLQPYEHYDYVVILARNEFDWQKLLAMLRIQSRVEYTVAGGSRKIGMGRCVDAAKFIAAMEEQGYGVA